MAIVKEMILLGGGGHAAVVTESARAAGFTVLGYLDDGEAAPGTRVGGEAATIEVQGLKRLGALAELPRIVAHYRHAHFHAAVGDPALRRKWLDLMGDKPAPPVIHPTAAVSPSAKIGDGVFIGPQAVVNARTILGRGVIVNSGAIVEHDCQVDEFAHIAPGSVLAGNVRVGAKALVGVGATVLPGMRIGKGATLGAGAVAISDVPPGVAAAGVPAQVMAAAAEPISR